MLNMNDQAKARFRAAALDPATQPPPAVVSMDGISLHYPAGIVALEGINLALPPGSFTFITGDSGAGKTSLLGIIGMALQATSGTLRVLGHDVAGLDRNQRAAVRRQIGLVFQNFRLLNHLTALENVMLPLQVAGIPSSTREAYAKELLDWVDLGDRLDWLPPTLSGGQQQRVAIARAVISRPHLLLADEPTGSVDEEIGNRLIGLIQALHQEGTAVVIATHDRTLVQRHKYPEFRLSDGVLVPVPPLPVPPLHEPVGA
jgi:cell division transport system ATP-binding protein